MLVRAGLLAILVISSSISASANNSTWPLKNGQHPALIEWAKKRAEEVAGRDESIDRKDVDKELTPHERYIRFEVPSPVDLRAEPATPPDKVSIRDIQRTVNLYWSLFGRNNLRSIMWSGVETGNALTSNMDYRWNSLKEAGFYDPVVRKRFIENLKLTGVKNLRFGFSNHEIFKNPDGKWNQKSWQAADEMIRDLTRHGIDLSLDLHHFGIESRFCVDRDGRPATYIKNNEELCDKAKYDPTKSFYLHPEWPDYFADFSLEAFRRYHKIVKAFTFINEPETVKGFNSGLWHGAFPGWLTPPMPTAGYYEAQRAINIGIAAVKARIKIEDYIRKQKIPSHKRPIFLHTEAMVPKPHWPDFENFIRYITSDTILGADWIMKERGRFARLAKSDLPLIAREAQWELSEPNQRTVLHLLTSQTVWWGFTDGPNEQKARAERFFNSLDRLQNLHYVLLDKFGQTMRSYTVLGIDYYAHNEEKLEPKPEYYIEQIKSGKRVGMYQAARAYYERYKMALMVTESGTPYMYYGARWHQQMLLETAKLSIAGIPFLGYTMYPAIDTYGWEHAISRPKEPVCKFEGSLYNPSGLLYMNEKPDVCDDVPGFAPMKPKAFINELNHQLRRAISM